MSLPSIQAAVQAGCGGVPPVPTVPTIISLPTIDNGPSVGDTVNASTGTWTGSPFSWSWTWFSGGVSVGTGPSYTVQGSDIGNTITVSVVAENAVGLSDPASSGPTNPVPIQAPQSTTSPVITSNDDLATPMHGDVLTCDGGNWSGEIDTMIFLWLKADTLSQASSAGANTNQIIIDGVSSDNGRSLLCQVTTMNAGGSTVVNSNASGVIGGYSPENTIAPVLTSSGDINNPVSGDNLFCDNGGWSHNPTGFSFQWYYSVGETPMAGQTTSTYQVQSADIGAQFYCAVTASNGIGSGSTANSNQSGTVSS